MKPGRVLLGSISLSIALIAIGVLGATGSANATINTIKPGLACSNSSFGNYSRAVALICGEVMGKFQWTNVSMSKDQPTSVSAAHSSRKVPGQTRVIFQSKTCEGCVIQPYRMLVSETLGRTSDKKFQSVTISNGRAEVQIPTSLTRGMSFELNRTPDRRGALLAWPYVVLQYEHSNVGDKVMKDSAVLMERGSFCWAGVKKDSVVRITLSTYRYPNPIPALAKSGLISIWASPQIEAMMDESNLITVSHAGIGLQNIPVCSIP
jgi:hypothetical protein